MLRGNQDFWPGAVPGPLLCEMVIHLHWFMPVIFQVFETSSQLTSSQPISGGSQNLHLFLAINQMGSFWRAIHPIQMETSPSIAAQRQRVGSQSDRDIPLLKQPTLRRTLMMRLTNQYALHGQHSFHIVHSEAMGISAQFHLWLVNESCFI